MRPRPAGKLRQRAGASQFAANGARTVPVRSGWQPHDLKNRRALLPPDALRTGTVRAPVKSGHYPAGAHPDTAPGTPVSDPASLKNHLKTRRIGERRSAMSMASGAVSGCAPQRAAGQCGTAHCPGARGGSRPPPARTFENLRPCQCSPGFSRAANRDGSRSGGFQPAHHQAASQWGSAAFVLRRRFSGNRHFNF